MAINAELLVSDFEVHLSGQGRLSQGDMVVFDPEISETVYLVNGASYTQLEMPLEQMLQSQPAHPMVLDAWELDDVLEELEKTREDYEDGF